MSWSRGCVIMKSTEALEATPWRCQRILELRAIKLSSDFMQCPKKKRNPGLAVEAEAPAVTDIVDAGILDIHPGKYWTFKLARNTAVAILRVVQTRQNQPAGPNGRSH